MDYCMEAKRRKGSVVSNHSCSADISQRERGSGKGNRRGGGGGRNRANRRHRSSEEPSPRSIGNVESAVPSDLPMDMARGIEQDPIMAR